MFVPAEDIYRDRKTSAYLQHAQGRTGHGCSTSEEAPGNFPKLVFKVKTFSVLLFQRL